MSGRPYFPGEKRPDPDTWEARMSEKHRQRGPGIDPDDPLAGLSVVWLDDEQRFASGDAVSLAADTSPLYYGEPTGRPPSGNIRAVHGWVGEVRIHQNQDGTWPEVDLDEGCQVIWVERPPKAPESMTKTASPPEGMRRKGSIEV